MKFFEIACSSRESERSRETYTSVQGEVENCHCEIYREHIVDKTCRALWETRRRIATAHGVNRKSRIGVGLTRGGRGTGLGGGPRWRNCCAGRRMICCGRRRWWICRVSTYLASLLQHLVYGVHICRWGSFTSFTKFKHKGSETWYFFSFFCICKNEWVLMIFLHRFDLKTCFVVFSEL